jgi:hypothetical protein
MNNQVKIVVTVPESDTEKLLKAIGDAGAGSIGNYTHCSFTSKGTGNLFRLKERTLLLDKLVNPKR